MADAVAFALRAEYEGTTTVETEDGSQERPIFAGGVLHADPGDFNVAEALDEGDGTIVVSARDQRLVDLLDLYSPLERVDVPHGAQVLSPYARLTADVLRHQASMRDVEDADTLSPAELISALEAQDAAAVAAVADAGDTSPDESVAPAPAAQPADVNIDVTTLSVEKLAAVLDADTATFADAGVVEVPAAIDELRRRAAGENKAAAKALADRALTETTGD